MLSYHTESYFTQPKKYFTLGLSVSLDLDDHRRLMTDDYRLSYLQTTSAIWTGQDILKFVR